VLARLDDLGDDAVVLGNLVGNLLDDQTVAALEAAVTQPANEAN